MILPVSAHAFAGIAFERLVYCLTAGTVLVAAVSVALYFLPARNSHTRFAVWFSALLAVVFLPFTTFIPTQWIAAQNSASPHRLLTISASWAEYIVLGWALATTVGLIRVAIGLWHLRQLRRDSTELDWSVFDAETRSLMRRAWGSRSFSLLVSSRVEVPTAIGFFRPAVILPAWLVDERLRADDSTSENLKYILLHELAHLRRWDDWTNLAQKLVKSVLFFHPGVLWLERKLALDREMACDDAVLAETGNPHNYAQCLTEVAEKSFVRRQIALAQAAVSRMKQLSRRVARILDHQRPQGTEVWKPAVSLVAGAALLCAITTSGTTGLIGFNDGISPSAADHSVVQPANHTMSAENGRYANRTPASLPNVPKFTPASLRNSAGVQSIPADLRVAGRQTASAKRYNFVATMQRARFVDRAGFSVQQRNVAEDLSASDVRLIMSSYSLVQVADQRQEQVVLVVFTSRRVEAAPGVHISAWELYFYVPAPAKQIPNKT